MNFIFYTDNNNLYYKNKTVISSLRKDTYIIKYNSSKILSYNGFGKISKKFNIDSKYYYFKHYSFKSTEEFCDKLNRGNVTFDNNNHKKLGKIH